MDVETTYERQLGFNAITRWLHSLRYRETLALLKPFDTPRVLEIGCAEAKLFDVLSRHMRLDYTGIDIREDFIQTACDRYAGDNFRARVQSATDLSGISADVVVALETMEHIPEHEVVRIVEAVAAIKPKLFICSVPVEIGPSIWLKNLGSVLCGYNRHIEYTWRETFWAGLGQLDRIPYHTTGHKGFDWRWLAQTIRHNMRIVKVRHLPTSLLPSTSVLIVATCETQSQRR